MTAYHQADSMGYCGLSSEELFVRFAIGSPWSVTLGFGHSSGCLFTSGRNSGTLGISGRPRRTKSGWTSGRRNWAGGQLSEMIGRLLLFLDAAAAIAVAPGFDIALATDASIDSVDSIPVTRLSAAP